jgi:hypothetical protein
MVRLRSPIEGLKIEHSNVITSKYSILLPHYECMVCLSRSLFLLFCFLYSSLGAQPDQRQVHTWIKTLSGKHDLRTVKPESVYKGTSVGI